MHSCQTLQQAQSLVFRALPLVLPFDILQMSRQPAATSPMTTKQPPVQASTGLSRPRVHRDADLFLFEIKLLNEGRQCLAVEFIAALDELGPGCGQGAQTQLQLGVYTALCSLGV